MIIIQDCTVHTATAMNIGTIASSPRMGVGSLCRHRYITPGYLGFINLWCQNDCVTLTCNTDQPEAKIAWHWSNKSEQGDTITVVADVTKMVCTCIVSDDGKDIGQANVTVIANGELLLRYSS